MNGTQALSVRNHSLLPEQRQAITDELDRRYSEGSEAWFLAYRNRKPNESTDGIGAFDGPLFFVYSERGGFRLARAEVSVRGGSVRRFEVWFHVPPRMVAEHLREFFRSISTLDRRFECWLPNGKPRRLECEEEVAEQFDRFRCSVMGRTFAAWLLID